MTELFKVDNVLASPTPGPAERPTATRSTFTSTSSPAEGRHG